jgi:hypothetical protein
MCTLLSGFSLVPIDYICTKVIKAGFMPIFNPFEPHYRRYHADHVTLVGYGCPLPYLQGGVWVIAGYRYGYCQKYLWVTCDIH